MKYPVLSGPVLIAGRKAVVRLADSDIVIDAPVPVLREIFRLCDGRTPKETVMRQLGQRWDRGTLRRLFAALEERGAIVDANRLALQSWRYVENPSRVGEAGFSQEARALSALAARRAAQTVAGKYHRAPRFGLRRLLERRKSLRTFSGRPVSPGAILAMLWAAYGIQAQRPGKNAVRVSPRTVPSGGGIYPLDVALVNMKSAGTLEEGIYSIHFRNDQSVGLRLVSRRWRDVYGAFLEPENLRRAQGVIVISGSFDLAARKYGNRALLLVTVEAGHAAQNVLLAATDLGVGAVEICGFLEDRLERLASRHRGFLPLTTIIFGGDFRAPKRNPTQIPHIAFEWIDMKVPRSALPFYLGNARSGDSADDRDYCWGRSPDPLLAHDKAIAESVERLACERFPAIYRARYSALENALDPREVVLYTKDQYSRRDFPYVPFDESTIRWWIDGTDHRTGKKVPVLADLVYFGDKFRAKRGSRHTAATTSGAAAFTSEEGALCRAVLELCERDAFMCAWVGRFTPPRVPRSKLPASINSRLSVLSRLGLRVVVKNLTQDIIPVILVFAQHTEKAFTVVGAAADFDAESALDSALMECEAIVHLRLQSTSTRSIGPSEVRSPLDHLDLYAQRRYFQRANFLAEGSATAGLSFNAGKSARSWNELLAILHQKDFRLISVDLTPPGAALDDGRIPLHVVRAIVPGLVPISFRTGTEPLGLRRARDVAARVRLSFESMPLFPHPLG